MHSRPARTGKSQRARPLVIGWKEAVWFPEWGIGPLPAKIDTGARTSALDVDRFELDEGGRRARLWLVLDRNHHHLAEVVAPVVDTVRVRSSSGCCEVRPVIQAHIGLGPVERLIRLTVTRRPLMRHRVLLGRQALAGAFVVDVTQRYLLPPREG